MSDSGTVDYLITKNFRAGSLVAYWALKSRLIRTCAIAFHKWVRFAVVAKAVATMEQQMVSGTPSSAKSRDDETSLVSATTSQPADGEDDVMSEEMEKMRRCGRGDRTRRHGVVVPSALTINTSEEPDKEGFAAAAAKTNASPSALTLGAMTPNLEKTVAAAKALTSKSSLLAVDTDAIAASVGRSLKNATNRSKEEKKLDAFASAVHDAIIDGKRNLLRKCLCSFRCPSLRFAGVRVLLCYCLCLSTRTVVSLARDIISGAGMTTSSLSLLNHSMALEEMDSYTKIAAPGSGPGRRQSLGSRPYLQNSYSKPREEAGRSSTSAAALLSERDSVDASPSIENADASAQPSQVPFAEEERGRAEKKRPVRRRSSSAVTTARTTTAEIGGDFFPSRPRRSHSVSPARRRWRKMQLEEAEKPKHVVQHQHSAQYQRVLLMRQMKAQTEAELKKANEERDGKAARRASSFTATSGLTSERGRSNAVYAFGSSTFSDKNIAQAPVSSVRNDILYNSGHYPHVAVASSGYGTVPAMHHSATIDTQIGRAAGLAGRARMQQGSAAVHSGRSLLPPSGSSSKRTASYMQPTHASDKRIVEAIKERTLSPAVTPHGQSWFSAKVPSPVSRTSSNASLARLGDSDSVTANSHQSNRGRGSATASPNTVMMEAVKYRPTGKAVQPPRQNRLYQERQAMGVLPLRTDKPPPGMERAQWLLMMGINPHHANNFKRSR